MLLNVGHSNSSERGNADGAAGAGAAAWHAVRS